MDSDVANVGTVCEICAAELQTSFTTIEEMEKHALFHSSQTSQPGGQQFAICFPSEPIPFSLCISSSGEGDKDQETEECAKDDLVNKVQRPENASSSQKFPGIIKIEKRQQKEPTNNSNFLSRIPLSIREHLNDYFSQQNADGKLVSCYFPKCQWKQPTDSWKALAHFFSHWSASSPLFYCGYCNYKSKTPIIGHFRIRTDVENPHPGKVPKMIDKLSHHEFALLKLMKTCFPLHSAQSLAKADQMVDIGSHNFCEGDATSIPMKPCVVLITPISVLQEDINVVKRKDEIANMDACSFKEKLFQLNKQRNPSNLACNQCSKLFPWTQSRLEELESHVYAHMPTPKKDEMALIKILEQCFGSIHLRGYHSSAKECDETLNIEDSDEGADVVKSEGYDSDWPETSEAKDPDIEIFEEASSQINKNGLIGLRKYLRKSAFHCAARKCLKFFWDKDKNYAYCRLCDRPVKTKISKLKMHSCTHITVPLFFCELCNLPLMSQKQGLTHCKKLHGRNNSSCIRNNFEKLDSQLAKNFLICFDPGFEVTQHQVEEMRKTCPKKVINRNQVPSYTLCWKNPKGESELLSKRLQLFCNQSKQINKLHVICSFCGLKVVTAKLSMENHLISHLPHAVFGCKLCLYKGNQIQRHYYEFHKESEVQIIDCRGNFEDLLLQYMSKCFPEDSLKKQNDEFSKRQSKFQLAVANVKAAGSCGQLRCKQCGKSKNLQSLSSHVLWHFRKPVYFCNYCSYRGAFIENHQQKTHKYEGVSFQDYTYLYSDELFHLFQKCFSVSTQISPSDETVAREAHLLLKQLLKGNKSVKCQLCSENRQYVKVTGAEQHAIWHLGKSLFVCNLCNYSGSQIKHHFKMEHPEAVCKVDAFLDTRLAFPNDFLSSTKACFCEPSLEAEVKLENEQEKLIEADFQVIQSTADEKPAINELVEHSDLVRIADDSSCGKSIEKKLAECSSSKFLLKNKLTAVVKECDNRNFKQENGKRPSMLFEFMNNLKADCRKKNIQSICCCKCKMSLKLNHKSLQGHILMHENCDCYSCKQCGFKSTGKPKMIRHFKGAHPGLSFSMAFVDDLRYIHDDKLFLMAKLCFENVKESGEDKKKPEKFLLEMWNIIKRLKQEGGNKDSIACNLCKNSYKIVRTSLTVHVYRHTNRCLFKCRICAKELFADKSVGHLRTNHPTAPPSSLDDLRFLADDKLVQNAQKCFGVPQVRLPPKAKKQPSKGKSRKAHVENPPRKKRRVMKSGSEKLVECANRNKAVKVEQNGLPKNTEVVPGEVAVGMDSGLSEVIVEVTHESVDTKQDFSDGLPWNCLP